MSKEFFILVKFFKKCFWILCWEFFLLFNFILCGDWELMDVYGFLKNFGFRMVLKVKGEVKLYVVWVILRGRIV